MAQILELWGTEFKILILQISSEILCDLKLCI